MTIQNNAIPKYYDLHISGVGYVNRIREVSVKRGDSFFACDISALHGADDAIEYTRFDCRVSGNEAERLIKKIQPYEADHKKILIGFKLGDLYTDIFTYEKGDKKGQTGVSLKARLLLITFIQVDGQRIYTLPPKADDGNQPANSPQTVQAEAA